MSDANFIPMDFFPFKSHVVYYIRGLLKDPIHTQPDEVLIQNGFDGETLQKLLVDRGIITKKEKIVDHDKQKNPIRAFFQKKICVGSEPEVKIKRMWQELFQKNINESLKLDDIDEATAGGIGAGYEAPLFGMMRRVFITERQAEMIKKHILDEMAIADAGNFAYDVPFTPKPIKAKGKKKKKKDPSMERHNGVRRSISVSVK